MKSETKILTTTGLGISGIIINKGIRKLKFKRNRNNKEGNYNVFLNICIELGIDFISEVNLNDELIEKICRLYKQRTGNDFIKDFKYAFN